LIGGYGLRGSGEACDTDATGLRTGQADRDRGARTGLEPGFIAKLASNENPLGSSPKALAAATRALADTRLYPENSAFYLRRKLAEKLGLEPAAFTVSAGSNELLYMMGDLFLDPGVEVVMGRSAFITMKIAALLYGATPVEVPLLPDMRHDLDAMLAAITPRTRIVYLPDPNNPTGTACAPEDVVRFVRALPEHVVFVYDEAYAEYRDNAPDLRPLLREGRKVLCTRTFSKIYGLAGLRMRLRLQQPGAGDAAQPRTPAVQRLRPRPGRGAGGAGRRRVVAASRKANREGLEQLAEGWPDWVLRSFPARLTSCSSASPKRIWFTNSFRRKD
jgi:histidinol-phosphate aminotransferase